MTRLSNPFASESLNVKDRLWPLRDSRLKYCRIDAISCQAFHGLGSVLIYAARNLRYKMVLSELCEKLRDHRVKTDFNAETAEKDAEFAE